MNEITCSKCNKKISKENLAKYKGGYTSSTKYMKQCKPCLNKASRKNGKKKSEALKLWRSFYN